MRRLRRVILNAITVLSLLLCVATVVLWVRSYFVSDRWHLVIKHYGSAVHREGTEDNLSTCRGAMQYMHGTLNEDWEPSYAERKVLATQPSWRPPDPPPDRGHYSISAAAASIFLPHPGSNLARPGVLGALGFSLWQGICGRGTQTQENGTFLIVPFWFLTCMTAAPGLATAVSARRRRLTLVREKHGLCACCSYNLTGNFSGVCPECGMVVRAVV
jgi:hypothetical protein